MYFVKGSWSLHIAWVVQIVNAVRSTVPGTTLGLAFDIGADVRDIEENDEICSKQFNRNICENCVTYFSIAYFLI